MDCVNQLDGDLIPMHQREGIELAKKEAGISVKQICEILELLYIESCRKGFNNHNLIH